MLAYLNELSLPNLNSLAEVINIFQEFGLIYKQARASGIREIRIQEAFFSHQFSNRYSFYDWANDNRADEDLRTLFKSVFGSVPYVDSIFENYQKEHDRPLEMRYQNQICIGFGLSSDMFFNTISFSFDGQNWSLPNYPLSITSIVEDEDGELSELEENTIAKNISTINHVLIHQEFINQKIAGTITNGKLLWKQRKEIFPNLEFCAVVESQIENMNAEDISFQQIVNRLFDLQNTAIIFNGNPIRPQDFPTKTTKESQTRERLPELKIICPDGNKRLFSWHSKFTPGALRIHFVPFENEKKILVGYIGKKII